MKLIDADHLVWRFRKKILPEIKRCSSKKNLADHVYAQYMQIMLDTFIREIKTEPECNPTEDQDKYGNMSLEEVERVLDIDISPQLWRGICRSVGFMPTVARFMRFDDEKFILTRGVGKKLTSEMLELKDKIREAIEDGKL